MKKTLLGLTLGLSLTLTGCLGPNHAFNSLNTWNAGLSDMDWVNEIVFLGLFVVGVYPIALLGDVLIFNTMDYWQGNNPINVPGPFPDTFRYEPELEESPEA